MKKIVASAVIAAAAAVALGTSGTASATDVGYDARTYIYWTGANCIQVNSAQKYNPQYSTTNTICGGTWNFSEGNIWPNDLFGADPIMGNANYIECAVYRAGRQVWHDSAFAGDGTDVSCLRRAAQ